MKTKTCVITASGKRVCGTPLPHASGGMKRNVIGGTAKRFAPVSEPVEGVAYVYKLSKSIMCGTARSYVAAVTHGGHTDLYWSDKTGDIGGAVLGIDGARTPEEAFGRLGYTIAH